MKEETKIEEIDLAIFEKNGKFEFVRIIKKNKLKATEAINRFLISLKNEANGSKETSRIIIKFVATQTITKEEEKHLKTQVADVFKILGIGVPFMLIPGASLLIPFLLKAADKKGIDLYPSNFKRK